MAAYLFVIRIPAPEREKEQKLEQAPKDISKNDSVTSIGSNSSKLNLENGKVDVQGTDDVTDSTVTATESDSLTESGAVTWTEVRNSPEKLTSDSEVVTSADTPCKDAKSDGNLNEEVNDDTTKSTTSGDVTGATDETADLTTTGSLKNVGSFTQSSELDIKEEYQFVKLIEDEPLLEITRGILEHFGIENAAYQKTDNGKSYQITFVDEGGDKSESILNKLAAWKIGDRPQTSVCIFPADIYRGPVREENIEEEIADDRNEGEEQIESKFKKSIKAKMLVTQVVNSVRNNAEFTFDYLLLTVLASVISALGLAENSSVILVASMLVSPLMGPILAGTFGFIIQNTSLRNLGIKSELKGLLICVAAGFRFGLISSGQHLSLALNFVFTVVVLTLTSDDYRLGAMIFGLIRSGPHSSLAFYTVFVTGFSFGLISGGISLNGAGWGSTDSYPSDEMKSRGMLRSLWVGLLIALPSGAGVALSVLGDNTGSLVGVAISASLLPPAVNAGMLWAFSFLTAISPPEILVQAANPTSNNQSANTTSELPSAGLGCASFVNNHYTPVYSCNMSHDMAMLGLLSLCLTLLNISCIFISAIGVLKIKEVAPQYSVAEGTKTFWEHDIQVVKESYMTTKGKDSITLAQQAKEILNDWKIQQGQNPAETLRLQKILEEVENSPEVLNVQGRIPGYKDIRPFSVHLASNFTAARDEIVEESCSDTLIMKDTTAGYDVYKTFHGNSNYNLSQLARNARSRQRPQSPESDIYVINEANEEILLDPLSDGGVNMKLLPSKKGSVQFQIGNPASSLFHRRQRPRKKDRFEIHKVHEPVTESSSSATQPLLLKT